MIVSEEEDNLVEQLKKICYPNGREKNPSESADIFHSLGKIYREKSPDKIALIQSATLLNGALVRKPGAPDIIRSLVELCEHVLSVAKADKKGNLLTLAESFKKDVVDLRHQVKQNLNSLHNMEECMGNDKRLEFELQRINDIQVIHEFLSASFSDIMKRIAESCVDLLGPPPCQYALVGMGSLAKREVTPYSDFECIIILEDLDDFHDETKLEYFRWFAVVFQIILINFGETLIAGVAVPTLNNSYDPDPEVRKKYKWFYDSYTPSGISFDGMVPFACKSPLGRQQHTEEKPWKNELIKPVSEMLKYLNADEDLKNGYHLADMLTKTCFVQGNTEVYDQFHKGVLKQLEAYTQSEGSLKDTFIEKVVDEFQEDFDNFNFHSNTLTIQFATQIDIKKFVYRSPTLAVASLARYHGIYEVSCYDMLDKLVGKGILKPTDAHRIKYAVAVSCELRQKFYLDREAQNDNWTVNGVSLLYQLNMDAMKQLETKLGKQSLVKCLETGVLLQKAVSNHYRAGASLELKSSGVKKLVIHSLLGFPEDELKAMINEEYVDENGELRMFNDITENLLVCSALLKTMPEVTFSFMEKVFRRYTDNLPDGKDCQLECQLFPLLAAGCTLLNKYENCLEYNQKGLAALLECESVLLRSYIPSVILLQCNCYEKLEKKLEAYECCESVLRLLQHPEYKSLPQEITYMTLYCKAQLLVDFKLYEDAIECVKKCIDWRVKVAANPGRDNYWLDFQACLWNCYFRLDKPEMYTEIALRMVTGNFSEDLKSGDLLVYVLEINILLQPRDSIAVFRKYKQQLGLLFQNGEKPVHSPRIPENIKYISDPGTKYFGHTFGSYLTLYGECYYLIGEDAKALLLLHEAKQQFQLEPHANSEHIQRNNRLTSQCRLYGIAHDISSFLPGLSMPGLLWSFDSVGTLQMVVGLLKEKKYQKAYRRIKLYRNAAAIKFDDIDTQFLYHLAVCYKEFNRFHEAIVVCQTTITIRQEMTRNPAQDETLHTLIILLNECQRKLGCSPVKTHVFSPLVSVHAYNLLVFTKQRDAFREDLTKIFDGGIKQISSGFDQLVKLWMRSLDTNLLFPMATLSAGFSCIYVCLKLKRFQEARGKMKTMKQHVSESGFRENVVTTVFGFLVGIEQLLSKIEEAWDSKSTCGAMPI